MKLKHKDGSELEVGPGDAYIFEPGHDAWVLGDEAFIGFDLTQLTQELNNNNNNKSGASSSETASVKKDKFLSQFRLWCRHQRNTLPDTSYADYLQLIKNNSLKDSSN